VKQDSLISWPVPAGLVLLLVVGVRRTNSQPPCLVGEFLFVIYHRRELFIIKSLTWLLDRTLLVGDSKDTANKSFLTCPHRGSTISANEPKYVNRRSNENGS